MDPNKVCPNCGRQNIAEAQWCAGCGSSIASVPVSGGQEWQSDVFSQTQGPNTAYPTSGQTKQKIASAIQTRAGSDEIMPVWWVLMPIVGILALVFLIVFLNFIGLGIGVVLFGALFAIFVFHLINRQNEHIKRETVLRNAITALIREKAREQYKEQQVSGQVATMESINQEASYKEQKYNVVMFTIMAFIPLVNIYVLYVLTKHPYEHDQRWHAFTQQVQIACSHLGMNIVTPSWKAVPQRSFIVYFIIGIVFAPFLLYWMYVLINDPNEHYRAQWQFEDQIMTQI